MKKASVIVVGPRDREFYNDKIPIKTQDDTIVVNTTSRGGWSSELSPFLLGPCNLYGNIVSKNMENAWQFAKLYSQHAKNGEPTKSYWEWAKAGWADKKAHRYPMGKGARPLCSWWDGRQLDYIQARRRIYIPLYAKLVVQTNAFKRLQEMRTECKRLVLWDFDGYQHRATGMNYLDVIHDPKKKMGHAFVIAMLLTNELEINGDKLKIRLR